MGRTARVGGAVAVCAVLVAAGSAIVAGAADQGEDVEAVAVPSPTPEVTRGDNSALAALDASLDDLLAQIDALENEIEATPPSVAPPAGQDLAGRTSGASPTPSAGSVAPGVPGGAYEHDDEYEYEHEHGDDHYEDEDEYDDEYEYEDDEYEDEHDQRDDD